MPFVGALMNTYPSNYQKYGLWDITAAVPATPGGSFQADTENAQITGKWPPAIWLRISTDSTGTETVLYAVATPSGAQSWTTSSKAGFDATQSHTYGWDWESDNITFFIDAKQVWQVATPQDGSYTTNPMFLYLFTGANYRGNGDPKAASLPFHANVRDVSIYPSLATPIPPNVTAGTGPDQLVLKMSGDAYANGDGTSDAAGDPSFTVSVDGKQVGGTFITVASHSAGQSQSFLLNGTFGTGTHTAAVTFLNDAWDGSRSTDRNLYVNDVLYAGADTLQSAGLYTGGTKDFTVTGGTAPTPAAASPAATTLSAALASTAAVSAAPSPDDAVITSGGSQPITDSSGNLWTIVNGQVAINGAADATTSNVVKLAFVGGKIWHETGGNAWQDKAAPTDSWAPAGGTMVPPISVGISANQQNQVVDATTAHLVSDAGATIDITAPGIAAATLGAGPVSLRFAALLAVNVTGGSGAAQVTMDGGTLSLDVGTGKLTVAGGSGVDAYAYHAGSGGLTISDFTASQGDVLKIDSALQAAMKTTADGSGGTLLTFGPGAGSIDLQGLAALPSNGVKWV